MIASHQQSGADVTIAGLPVSDADASSMGIMRVDDADRVVGFLEKPQTKEEMDLVRLDPEWFAARDVAASRARPAWRAWASICSIARRCWRPWKRPTTATSARRCFRPPCARIACRCIFSRATGKTSARSSRSTRRICNWPDTTRLQSLAGRGPHLHAAAVPAPLAHRSGHDPGEPGGRRLRHRGRGRRREQHHRPALPHRPRRGDPRLDPHGKRLLRSQRRRAQRSPQRQSAAGRGGRHHIEGAIIDKNCRIGRGVRVVNSQGIDCCPETKYCVVSDGIIVVPKGSVLPDGWAM